MKPSLISDKMFPPLIDVKLDEEDIKIIEALMSQQITLSPHFRTFHEVTEIPMSTIHSKLERLYGKKVIAGYSPIMQATPDTLWLIHHDIPHGRGSSRFPIPDKALSPCLIQGYATPNRAFYLIGGSQEDATNLTMGLPSSYGNLTVDPVVFTSNARCLPYIPRNL